jgi:N-acetylmuramoyl-L-alanine amidase
MRRSIVTLAFLVTAAAAAAEPIQVKVATDTAGSSTRIVLTFAKKTACTVTEETGRLRVACDAPLAPEPSSVTVDDGIVKSLAAEGDRAIIVTTGRGFTRADSFELRNPTRLVLDFSGSRTIKTTAAPAPAGKAAPVIVIDPGHGGVEPGAIGPTGLAEKDLTLDLARRLKALLEKQGNTVVLTRDDDRVLPLDDRTAIANHNKAILFISIHLNASKRKSAVGAETYYLSTAATDAEARTLAGIENKAYQAPGSDAAGAPGTPPDHGLELVLWDLAQNGFIAESSRLAEAVQVELNAMTGVRDRGVRQAPFRVLMGATMPAILVEAGFISNPEEEARLKDDAYKEKIAEAIARAVGTIAVKP